MLLCPLVVPLVTVVVVHLWGGLGLPPRNKVRMIDWQALTSVGWLGYTDIQSFRLNVFETSVGSKPFFFMGLVGKEENKSVIDCDLPRKMALCEVYFYGFRLWWQRFYLLIWYGVRLSVKKTWALSRKSWGKWLRWVHDTLLLLHGDNFCDFLFILFFSFEPFRKGPLKKGTNLFLEGLLWKRKEFGPCPSR